MLPLDNGEMYVCADEVKSSRFRMTAEDNTNGYWSSSRRNHNNSTGNTVYLAPTPQYTVKCAHFNENKTWIS